MTSHLEATKFFGPSGRRRLPTENVTAVTPFPATVDLPPAWPNKPTKDGRNSGTATARLQAREGGILNAFRD